MTCFEGHPWVHIFVENALRDYARQHGIAPPNIDHTIRYMFDPVPFNRRPAKAYTRAVAKLRGMQTISNDLYRLEPRLLAHPLGQQALAAGFDDDELLSETHYAAARKI